MSQESHIFFYEKIVIASWSTLVAQEAHFSKFLFFSVIVQDREIINPTLCLAKMGKYYRLCEKFLSLHRSVLALRARLAIELRARGTGIYWFSKARGCAGETTPSNPCPNFR